METIEDLTNKIKLDPNNYLLYFMRGGLYLNRAQDNYRTDIEDRFNKDYARCIADYTKGIELCKNEKLDEVGFGLIIMAFFNRGVAYNNRGVYGKAIEDYKMVLQFDPNADDARGALERAETNRMRFGNEEYNNEKKLNNELAELVREAKEKAEREAREKVEKEEKEKFDKMIAEMTETIRKNPNDWNNYKLRGEAYITRNHWDQAIENFTDAIRLIPNMPDAYAARGNVYLQKRNYDQAIKDFDEALRIDPNCKNASQGKSEVIKKVEKEAKEKKQFRFGLVIHLCLCAAYLFILYGTDIVSAPWKLYSFSFMRCVPLIIFSLAIGMVSLLLLKESNYGSGIWILFVMILVQSISICVWKGNVGILLIYLIGRIVINTLCAIPGLILAFKETP